MRVGPGIDGSSPPCDSMIGAYLRQRREIRQTRNPAGIRGRDLLSMESCQARRPSTDVGRTKSGWPLSRREDALLPPARPPFLRRATSKRGNRQAASEHFSRHGSGEPGSLRIETASAKKDRKKISNHISLIIQKLCRNAVAGEEFLKMVVDRKRGPGLYHRHRRRVRGAQIAVLQNSDLSLDRVKPDERFSSCLAIETEKEKRGRRSSCGFIER